MLVLPNDGLQRSDEARRARRRSDISWFVCLFLSLALMVLSALDVPILRRVRAIAGELAAPLAAAVEGPVARVRQLASGVGTAAEQATEIERLRLENRQLAAALWRAGEVERRLDRLSAALNSSDVPLPQFATGRLVLDARSALRASAVISLGRSHGVRIGYTAVNRLGLLGRVVESGETASRILLLTDAGSRIPVRVGSKGARAILAGDGTAEPRLLPADDGFEVVAGDEVVTSGQEGLLPPGLKVGRIASVGEVVRVHLAAQPIELDYVTVLLFDAPRLETSEDRRQPRAAIFSTR